MMILGFQIIFILLFTNTPKICSSEESSNAESNLGDAGDMSGKSDPCSCVKNQACNTQSESMKSRAHEEEHCDTHDCKFEKPDEGEIKTSDPDENGSLLSKAEKLPQNTEINYNQHKSCEEEIEDSNRISCDSEENQQKETKCQESTCSSTKSLENDDCKKSKATNEVATEQDLQEKEEEVDPELENIPLREILLKLKPEGLTDEEEDQTPDYATTEASVGDVEVEEEVPVSSGSAEKHEQDPEVNDTKGSSSSTSSNNSGSKKVVCMKINGTEPVSDVEIINATTLMRLLQVDPNVTGRMTAGSCHLVYFFSPYCPFSVMGSPYVNALARSLPNIPVYGLDSIEHHSLNTRYGVIGTPTLLLFHNGNGVSRYNASEYSVSQLMAFVRHYTDQEITNINVTSLDFRAKLPSQIAEARPYALWAARLFLLTYSAWFFLTSELCARLTEAVLNNWREAEAQNDHQD